MKTHTDDIDEIIDELKNFFGLKEDVSKDEIFRLLESNKLKKALKMIAMQLGLPVDVNIVYADESQFQNRKIAAQVVIPGHLPFYGSSKLIDYPITVKMHKKCLEDITVFVMVMAHELSHILLHSLHHTKKDSEIYTDLTAMMLGFRSIFQNGRKATIAHVSYGFLSTTTHTNTTTYGYLSDKQFDFAMRKISLILKKNRKAKRALFIKIRKINKLLQKHKKIYFRFSKFIKYLSNNENQSKKISSSDGRKISLFFQPNYANDIKVDINKIESGIIEVEKFYKELNQYNEMNLNKLKKYDEESENIIEIIKEKITKFKKDEKTLKKYVSIFYKLRLMFSRTSSVSSN